MVIPIAGLGTTSTCYKGYSKRNDAYSIKTIIQYVVEEALKAGFKEIIFITHSSKSSVENHFDASFELEATLEKELKEPC